MLLETLHIFTRFEKGVLVLADVNIGVQRGEIVSIIGNNGAGKTTLLRTISGLLKPEQGTILLEGRNIRGLRPSAVAKLGIAHVPEGRRVFANENIRDNLLLGGYSRWKRERKEVLAEANEMIERHPIIGRHLPSQLAGTLSGGEQQLLAILRGLMMRPLVLLLDEPTLGLAPLMVREVFEMIKTCKNESDMGILLVEQMAYRALTVSDKAYVLERGSIRAEGTGRELLSSRSIQKAYFGSV
jgi:branched-chain amino acid transport system ATP-binding protein